uniref:Glycosyltransferase n=2 Tax=Landoltia punctata TaxID=50518 RepID=A0A859N8A0_LANPU|nr:2-hydroxyflavanone C-glycosyltransferase [Landoltia punctata]
MRPGSSERNHPAERPTTILSGSMAPAAVPHVALLPSSGMGHLTPFLRLAAALASHGCVITFITPTPVVSAAEARHVEAFISSSPLFRRLEFPLLPFDVSSVVSDDPFFLQFERISRSARHLGPVLSSVSPPLSALILDVTLTSSILPIAAEISLPAYILFTSSAGMLSLCLSYPEIAASGGVTIKIPGVAEDLAPSSLPQPLRDPRNLFTGQFIENGRAMARADGIIINTWEALEPATLAALQGSKAVSGFPLVIPVGPLLAASDIHTAADDLVIPWLDAQPASSVVFVSFGSRTALSAEQLRELAAGLESSGCRFLWVLKTKKVDREDQEGEKAVDELLGEGFLQRVEWKGKVVSGWVDQRAVLDHPSVGGFVSHCGWNSVTEAALGGMRVLAWPRHGDQRINAMVVEKSGLGKWPSLWTWEGDDEIVRREEIAGRVAELMASPAAAAAAAKVKEEAVRAATAGGSSQRQLEDLVSRFTCSGD